MQHHIMHITIQIGLWVNLGNRLGWDYMSFFPEDFGVFVVFLNSWVSRALSDCIDSSFLVTAFADLPFGPCSIPADEALPQIADVTLLIMRVISSMLGICIM